MLWNTTVLNMKAKPPYPGDTSSEFRAISPLGKISVLEHESFTVADSSVICRYLDRLVDDKSLYPEDLQEEARAGWVEEYADSRLIENCAGIFQERLLKPKMLNQPNDEVRLAALLNERLPTCLRYDETFVPESGYLVGDSLSIADISLVSCFIRAQYGDFEVDAEAYPKLGRYLDRAYEEPLVTNRLASEKTNLPPGL